MDYKRQPVEEIEKIGLRALKNLKTFDKFSSNLRIQSFQRVEAALYRGYSKLSCFAKPLVQNKVRSPIRILFYP